MVNSGATKKYLLYAIGEIFLVMIGILLALQVSNWNENLKQKQKTENYLKSLTNDLNENISQIKQKHEGINQRFALIDQIKSKLFSPAASVDTIRSVVEKDMNFFLYTYNAFNNNTYETLKNTGELEYLDNWLKEELQKIHFLQQDLIEVSTRSGENFDDIVLNYKSKFPPVIAANYSTALQALSWEDVSYAELLRSIESLVWMQTVMYHSTNRRSEPLLQKYQWLLDTMKIEFPFLQQ
jgi:hypothetical protein